MKRFSSVLALLAVLLAACAGAPAPAPAADPRPAAVVEGFIAAYRELGFRGLPDGAQLERLSPFLSTRLAGLLRDARAGQQAYREKYPTDKPPLIDGDLFSSLFEGANRAEISETLEQADSAAVLVRYEYRDPRDGKLIEDWPDRFLLVPEAGRGWRIDDIEYLGGWDFAMKGRLSGALAETAALR
ncbi:MAG: hypothetical protein ACKO4A_17285 [Gammaproteobacteria bacterium]